jgi:hypothetical protein
MNLVKTLHKHLACPHNSPIPTGSPLADLPRECRVRAIWGCVCEEAVAAVIRAHDKTKQREMFAE